MMARRQAAAERTASAWDSMAVGAGGGAVKPVTVVFGGRVGAREARQAVVMLGVLFGFMRRMEMGRGGVAGEEIVGSGGRDIFFFFSFLFFFLFSFFFFWWGKRREETVILCFAFFLGGGGVYLLGVWRGVEGGRV